MDIENNKADRFNRLLAIILDIFVLLPIILPIAWMLGLFEYISHGTQPPIYLALINGVISYVIYYAINWSNLKNGQTWGKRWLGIKIVDQNGNNLSIKELLLKRYLFQYGIAYIPFIGNLLSFIDALFIFGKNRRCLHDLVAKTDVINVLAETKISQHFNE